MRTDAEEQVGAAAGGGARIADRILNISRHLAPVDEVFSFYLQSGSAPAAIGAASVIGPTCQRTGWYAREFYKSDPVIQNSDSRGRGAIIQSVINSREIERPDYREICFDRPRLRQKISFASMYADGRVLCNFYLRNPIGSDLIAALESLAAVALPSLWRHADKSRQSAASIVDRIEARLAASYPDLTLRERQVCARTIAGWTAEAAALDLGIGAGTALTYRRRAYSRYDYSSAGQFLERILD